MYQIIIQYAADKKLAPTASVLRSWAKQALTTQLASAHVTIRLVDIEEMTTLNETYRHKTGPTNVLSFPLGLPEEMMVMDMPMLGDIVICSDIVHQEAKMQQKSSEAHFAHMIIHGIFHLLGYNHETDQEAQVMESLEKEVMHTLGYPNPYRE